MMIRIIRIEPQYKLDKTNIPVMNHHIVHFEMKKKLHTGNLLTLSGQITVPANLDMILDLAVVRGMILHHIQNETQSNHDNPEG